MELLGLLGWLSVVAAAAAVFGLAFPITDQILLAARRRALTRSTEIADALGLVPGRDALTGQRRGFPIAVRQVGAAQPMLLVEISGLPTDVEVAPTGREGTGQTTGDTRFDRYFTVAGNRTRLLTVLDRRLREHLIQLGASGPLFVSDGTLRLTVLAATPDRLRRRLDALLEIAAALALPDDQLAGVAAHRLHDRGERMPVRLRLLDTLLDDVANADAIGRAAMSSESPELRLLAAERLGDVTALGRLATEPNLAPAQRTEALAALARHDAANLGAAAQWSLERLADDPDLVSLPGEALAADAAILAVPTDSPDVRLALRRVVLALARQPQLGQHQQALARSAVGVLAHQPTPADVEFLADLAERGATDGTWRALIAGTPRLATGKTPDPPRP